MKELRHLLLTKPHSLILKSDINPGMAIFSLINQYCCILITHHVPILVYAFRILFLYI